jgi:transposase
MNIEHKPWEWVAVKTEGGGYNLVKADEKTRKRQLKEFKEKRMKELEKDMNEIKDIF